MTQLMSFEPVCYLARSPEVFVVNSASNYHTLADLLGAARANPRGLAMASFGPGGSAHIGVEMLKLAAAVDMNYVPYPSQVSAINALLDNGVTSAFISYAGVSGQLKTGKLRALATASRERIESLPEVPTVAESGYKDFETEVRVLLFAPARTPPAVVTQLKLQSVHGPTAGARGEVQTLSLKGFIRSGCAARISASISRNNSPNTVVLFAMPKSDRSSGALFGPLSPHGGSTAHSAAGPFTGYCRRPCRGCGTFGRLPSCLTLCSTGAARVASSQALGIIGLLL